MCGRYTQKAARELIYNHFGIVHDEFSEVRITPKFDLTPRKVEEEPAFDIAPGTVQPVIRLNKDGVRVLTPMRWGFKLVIQNKKKLVFNTKSEGVMESNLWRKRFAENRCIIPATSFLEWDKKKKKHEVMLRDCELFGFAGLYGTWVYADGGQPELTFSIFTTEPNSAIKRLHNRQPVILDPRDYDEWLQPSERPPLHLLRIFSEEDTVITPIEAHKPDDPDAGLQPSLFDF